MMQWSRKAAGALAALVYGSAVAGSTFLYFNWKKDCTQHSYLTSLSHAEMIANKSTAQIEKVPEYEHQTVMAALKDEDIDIQHHLIDSPVHTSETTSLPQASRLLDFLGSKVRQTRREVALLEDEKRRQERHVEIIKERMPKLLKQAEEQSQN
eukprot:TRINITY_DN34948_c0_g1_i1.p1 TRINITY_DN34948_c0_g1~~TRINITY_DN34948_c0_g1_i1.p1  ORF type:complete len:153 (-),score=28.83 TRINITY_DN34948_c0_g1_i1:28-486(-)